jgi:nucleoside-diphosphate-sugar epimerase
VVSVIPLFPLNAPLEPTNSYAASKAAASIALYSGQRSGILLLRTYESSMFWRGGADSRFWPSLRKAAVAGEDFPMTEGEQMREFMSVREVATGFLERSRLPATDLTSAKVFYLSTGNAMSFKDFALSWWKTWGATGALLPGKLPYRAGEIMHYVGGPCSVWHAKVELHSIYDDCCNCNNAVSSEWQTDISLVVT